MRKVLSALALSLIMAAPANSQVTKLYGGDNGSIAPAYLSDSNPLPVSVVAGSGGSVAVTSTVNPTGTTAANSTSTVAAIPAASTTVTFTAPSSFITIANYSTTATLHVNLNSAGTATTSNFGISPGSAFTYEALPALASIKVIGSAASGSYGVLAH